MRNFLKWLLIPALAVGSLTACKEGNDMTASEPVKKLSDLPPEKIQNLSSRTFYFGHQSVGKDITGGLAMVLPQYPDIKLKVVEGESPDNLAPGVFLHSRIGKNRAPATKVEAFENVMNGGIGNQADAAFVKFCYVDAVHGTDVAQIFADYKQRLEALKTRYPETTFVHFTMPVKTVPEGWKTSVKMLIGREIPEYRDNANRTRFNDMLRAEYGGKDPIFDIAKLESTAGGSHNVFEYDGQKVEALVPAYTNDGGHLSDEGKRWIAEQLLIFLAELNYKS
jgi:hypothetical protein